MRLAPGRGPVSRLFNEDIPVTPDSHESAITEPVAQFLKPMIVDIRPSPGSANYYFYQHITGQIIFCITPNPSIWGENVQETSDFLPMVARRIVELMPRLQNIRVRRTWRGLYPMTPDGFPIIGWSKQTPGYLISAGMCGQGFMLGPSSRRIGNTHGSERIRFQPMRIPFCNFLHTEALNIWRCSNERTNQK